MNPLSITHVLQSAGATQLDASGRGTGLNAVWRIMRGDEPAILKTYSRRRSAVQTALTNVGNRISGRTSYTAAGRRETEHENLALWAAEGFDVPAIRSVPSGLQMPLPHLCMEFVEGPTMSCFLGDASVPEAMRDAALARFARGWAVRHERAERSGDARLLQEHGSFDHILVAGDRLVTFDLEASYRRGSRIGACIAGEVCGYVRSLFRRLDPAEAKRCLRVLVRAYPDPDRLAAVYRELFASPSPAARVINWIDRRWLRKPGTMHKFAAAQALQSALEELRPRGQV